MSMHPVEEVEYYIFTYNFSVLLAPNNAYDQTIH